MKIKGATEAKQQALDLAEASRETEWQYPSFVAELFKGNFHWDDIHPYPDQDPADKKIGDEFLVRLEAFLKAKVDPDYIDRTGDIPKEVYEGLTKLGCFAMKISKEYGGLGLSKINYNRAVALVGSHCASTAVLLSAHQSIGVPQPLILFGTEEQKTKYLPRFAKGEISAFALTEPAVGSDPAKMSTTAEPTADGEHYILNGEKLWSTNGVIASVIVVMAKSPSIFVKGKEKRQITAFIVERSMPGIEVVHRCQFMGLHGIQNGLIRFKNVKVPKENILWGLGKGLKLALITLNTGRLTVPAATSAGAKLCLRISRKWSAERVQWGLPVGKHEAVSEKLAQMASDTFAMESVTWLTSAMADQGKTDIRLEAAMAKLFCTEMFWKIADEMVQIRGGRGYESADSLKGRGEEAIPAERILRDSRINLIIEGSSEIMRLFIAREAMDMHFRLILGIMKPGLSLGERLGLVGKAAAFYPFWYLKQWVGCNGVKNTGKMSPRLKSHLTFVKKTARRLARTLFHIMGIYQQSLERRQLLLFRLVNIGTGLFAIASSCSRAAMLLAKDPSDRTPEELAHYFSVRTRSKIREEFRSLFKNQDRAVGRIASGILDGKYAWLEDGIMAEDRH